MRLAGKTALVTGGSRSIGRAIAVAFARDGADVAINYVQHPAEAEAVAREIEEMGRRALVIQADQFSESATVTVLPVTGRATTFSAR